MNSFIPLILLNVLFLGCGSEIKEPPKKQTPKTFCDIKEEQIYFNPIDSLSCFRNLLPTSRQNVLWEKYQGSDLEFVWSVEKIEEYKYDLAIQRIHQKWNNDGWGLVLGYGTLEEIRNNNSEMTIDEFLILLFS